METKKTFIWPKLRIGISSCLIGNKVRYNGEHKANEWLLTQLAPFVSWIAICPEVQMGLGVPREPMRLIGTATSARLITVKSKEDQTERAHQTIDRILKKNFKLDGFIFKKNPPTFVLERVKFYSSSGILVQSGMGLFSKSVLEKFLMVPMIEEGRLSDPKQREFFLNQLYIFSHFARIPKSTGALQEFHQNHKLQLMAYDPGKYKFLGRLAANSQKQGITEIFTKYEEFLSVLIKKPLNVKKYTNVFQHMFGYFKKDLNTKEKAHLLELLQDYRKSRISLISVSRIFNYLIEKYAVQYLEKQSLLNPYPDEILTGDRI